MLKKSIFIIFILIGALFLNFPTAQAITLTEAKIDFGTDASPIQSGWTRLGATNLYDEALGYGWNIQMSAVDRGAGSGGALDDLEQDIHWSGNPRTFSFHVDADSYDWTLYHGDTYATGSWDLYVNGILHTADITTGGSVWENITGTTNCAGGWLNFTMADLTTGTKWNGVEFAPSVPATQSTTVTTCVTVTTSVTSSATSTMSEYLVNGTTVSTTSGTCMSGTTTLYSTTTVDTTIISVDETVTVDVTESGDEGFHVGLEGGGGWNVLMLVVVFLVSVVLIAVRKVW